MLLPGWSSERAAEGKTRGEKMGGTRKRKNYTSRLALAGPPFPLGNKRKTLIYLEKGAGVKKCMIVATLKFPEMNVCTRSPKGYLGLRLKGEPGLGGQNEVQKCVPKQSLRGRRREGGRARKWVAIKNGASSLLVSLVALLPSALACVEDGGEKSSLVC